VFLDKVPIDIDNPRMSVEEVRQKIEKEAKRRLEEHLDQLRLEFERMRLESHRKWEEFLMRLDFPLPELVPVGSIPEPPPPPAAAPEGENLSKIREITRTIDAAGNQVDALKAFLSGCVTRSDRAVLLVSRGDALAVWKAEGFSPSEEPSLRAVSVLPASHPALAAAMEGAPITVSAGSPISALLSAADAQRALLCPIVVREKISALLYADQKHGSTTFDPEAIALLCFIIGAAVDRLVSRKIHPAPALKPIESLAPAPAAPEMEFEPEPEPEVEPPAALEVEEAPEEAPEEAEPEPEPPAPKPPPSRGIDFDTTGHPYRPPAGVVAPAGPRILRGPLAAVEEDPHEHAKKIARLLVSDIRLYNEAAIEEGRRHGDIYARMRDDIDRARQTYNDRVPESVRSSTNYFHEELIRSLADGSPDLLGS
jgi:hypothetical protein